MGTPGFAPDPSDLQSGVLLLTPGSLASETPKGLIGAVRSACVPKPKAGFAPATFSLPRKCSTTELHGQNQGGEIRTHDLWSPRPTR